MTEPQRSRLLMSDVASAIGKLRQLQAEGGADVGALIEELLRSAGVAETDPPQYNPYLPGVHTDPHPHYGRLRERNPVHHSDAVQAWVITGYADVVAALHDRRLSSRNAYQVVMGSIAPAQQPVVAAYLSFISSTLNQRDPPDHPRLRRILTSAMSPSLVSRRRPELRAIIERLIEAVIDPRVTDVLPRGAPGDCGQSPATEDGQTVIDLVATIARPLPLLVSAELLGIPTADRAMVLDWVEQITGAFGDDADTLAAMQRGDAAVAAFRAYLRQLLRARKLNPTGDVISRIAAADASEDEQVDLCMQTPLGAHENLRHTISVGSLALLSDGALVERLRREPALIPAAVEELLRYTSISPFVGRIAVEDLTIGGQSIRAGDQVLLMLAAANRDPEKFRCPEAIDPARRPNPHIAFGAGSHLCLGAALGRSVMVLLVTALLEGFPNLRLAATPPQWREQRNIRGLASLPVLFG